MIGFMGAGKSTAAGSAAEVLGCRPVDVDRVIEESFGKPIPGTVQVPVGCSVFPKEIFRASRRWAARHYPDLRYWNEPAKGGHFAAFEQPAIFVDEVRAAFRSFRSG